jgi:putative ABC transport system permease protein
VSTRRVRRTDLAWRNLSRERGRLAISVGGVAFAVLLILILRGLYAGFVDQATAYIRSVDADVWVAQEGSPADLGHSVSLLPPSVLDQLAGVDGVAEVAPLLTRPMELDIGAGPVDVFAVGVDARTGIGGPPGGIPPPAAGEVVIDEVFASNNDVARGDVLDVHGLELRVRDVVAGGNAVITQYLWVNLDDLAQTVGTDAYSYILVKGDGSASPEQLARDIPEVVAGTSATTAEAFASANTDDLEQGFMPVLWVLVVIALVIGSAVIGLTIYTATLEKRREYGVLKAIGFSNRRLVAIVVRQSLVAAVLGLAGGIALTFAVAGVIRAVLPEFVTEIGVRDVALAAAAALFMAIAATVVPLRPVTRLDPAAVFRV